MTPRLTLHPDRLLGADPTIRALARELYDEVAHLPILSPHGHTDPAWFARDEAFTDPTSLLVTPDHYLTRMLYSQGVPLEDLGVQPRSGTATGENSAAAGPREAWRTFAEHFHLFRGTPSSLWLQHTFVEVFGLTERLDADSADRTYDHIAECLAQPGFRPRALLDRFGIEYIATTDSPLSDFTHHRTIGTSTIAGRVAPTFRPDSVIDPDHDGYAANVVRLGELTGREITNWSDYLAALWERRRVAATHGATATDHGHPSAHTESLDVASCQRLLQRAVAGTLDHVGKEQLRGQLLTEMARMSVEDGMVMQLHAGSRRNHNGLVHQRFGRDKGGDIPGPIEYTTALRALLDRFGNDSRLHLVLFTLDESTYTRELAPLAGHYPSVFLGPPWWFLDSAEGMLRYRRAVTETAGFANCTGFVDDTRAFMSIPARHDVARRVDCRFLAELVADHRLELDEAHELAVDMVVGRTRQIFRLESTRAGVAAH